MEPNMTQEDETGDQHEVLHASSAGSSHHNDVVDNDNESMDLITQREKIQRQISALERYFDAEGHSGLSACCSSDGDSEDDNDLLDTATDLDAKHMEIQREIKELEETLGLGTEEHLCDNVGSPELPVSEEDSDDEDFELPMNAETCLEMNLVYQEVVKETLAELEKHLQDNIKQQKEIENQIQGPTTTTNPNTGLPSTKLLFIGNFLKPYFKDKDTGLGPPANPETKEMMASRTNTGDEKSIRRWEGWQKSLLISAIVQDTMKRMLQPKLSKMEYFRDKASKVEGTEKEIVLKQIEELEGEIANIRALGEDDLMGARSDEHDWDKIANIDFEGKRHAEDLKLFWQNYLHPSINKSMWKPDEIEKLKAIVEEHQGHNWETIAEKMETNRTAFMCFQSHQRYIFKELRKRAWTKDEDDKLRDLVQRKRIGNFIPYTQISYFMEGRDAAQLIYRWSQVLDPRIKRGPWSKHEDELLLKSVEKHGVPHWWRIRFDVPGRTYSQCRDRYLDCLSDDVKKGPWSDEEINMLMLGVQKHGVGKWAKIASGIPNRVDSQCMQKWRTLSRSTLPRRRNSKSAIPKGQTSISKARKIKKIIGKKAKKKRRVLRKVKAESDQSGDEEIEYMESDGEEKKVRSKGSSKSSKEPVSVRPKYTQPPLSEWIPRQTDQTMQTTEKLNIFFVNTPDFENPEEMNTESPNLISYPAYYTILNSKGSPVTHFKRYKTLVQHQPQKKRTFDDDMIYVPQSDVRKIHVSVLAEVLKMKQTSQQSTAKKRRLKQRLSGPSDSDTGGSATNSSSLRVRHKREVRPFFFSQSKLRAAVCPWMGHLLLPLSRFELQKVEADLVRERAALIELSSTEVFLLLLKILHVDTAGCKNVISARKNLGLPGIRRNTGVHPVVTQQIFQIVPANSEHSQPSFIKQQQFQQVLVPVLQPQQAPHLQPKQTQLSQHLETPQAHPPFAFQLKPCGKLPTQPQQQMPQLLISPGVQLAQPVLMSFTPCGQNVSCLSSSSGPASEPLSSQTTSRELVSSQTTSREPVSSQTTSRELVSSQTTCREPVSSQTTFREPVSSQTTCREPVSSQTTCSKPVSRQITCTETVTIQTTSSDSDSNQTTCSKPASRQTKSCEPVCIRITSSESDSCQTPRRGRVFSQATSCEPISIQTTSSESESPSRLNTESGATRPSKRIRKPTNKAKLLMEEEATKSKNQQRHKRPRLEEVSSTPQPASPVTWFISPSAKVPLNALNSSKLPGVKILPRPPAASATSPSSNPLTSTAQARIPLNMPGVFPGAVIFTVSNVPVSTPVMRPTVTTPNSVSSSTPDTTVTTTSPTVQGPVFSAASSAASHSPASPVVESSPVLTPVRAQGPQPLQGVPRSSAPSPAPVQKPPAPNQHPKPVIRLAPPRTAPPDPKPCLDLHLMFMENKATTQDWMKEGSSSIDSTLPEHSQRYLPPFVSTVNTLQNLLKAKVSLLKHSLKVLPNSAREPMGNDGTENGESVEQLEAVRGLVREKFSSNPAYQTLKARFLSCFTMPALLATIDPGTLMTNNKSDDDDDVDDDDDDGDGDGDDNDDA